MIKNLLCLVAESVIRDAETNAISVFNIMEGVIAQGFPLFINKITFLTIWEKEPADTDKYNAALTIYLEGDKLIENTIIIDFQGNNRNRAIASINGVLIKKPGILEFELSVEEGPVVKYSLRVDAQKSVLTSAISS